jgi:hypothetical protein
VISALIQLSFDELFIMSIVIILNTL